MSTEMIKTQLPVRTNEDAIIKLKQAGDYIRENAEKLVGTVFDDDIQTIRLEISIVFEPNSLVYIRTVKENPVRTVIPFAEDD